MVRWQGGAQSIYTRECVFGEIRTGLTVIITNIHQSVGTTPDVKFRWNGWSESEWDGEVGGSGERATAAAFMRTLAGVLRGGRRHVVLVVRALFFAFGFLHLALQLHFACVYTHIIYKYICISYIHAVFYAYVIYLGMSSATNFYIFTRNERF